MLAVASAVVVAHTGFGTMFNRLSNVTETREGLPATRAGTWAVAIDKIKKDPWFGEGPFFLSSAMAEDLGKIRAEFKDLGEVRTAYDPYPHSLYLYLLRTVGIVGLMAFLWFFWRTWYTLYGALQRGRLSEYSSAIVRLGLVLIPTFLAAQITLEFNRPGTMDYAQFIFALLGLLVGVSDRVVDSMPQPGAAPADRSGAQDRRSGSDRMTA